MIASVIVCTFNRCELLQRLLAALGRQTANPNTYEIIVVDDGSTDDTPAVCEGMKARFPHLVYIATGSNLGLSNAANAAVAVASGEFLLFTDDDCVPDANWVQRMCFALDHESIVAGAVVSPMVPYFKLCHNIAQFYPFMPGQKLQKLEFIAGANMGIRAQVFIEIGTFNPDTIITDMEFILRARRFGYTIAYAEQAIVLHDPLRVTLPVILSYAAHHARFTIQLRHTFTDVLATPWVLSSPWLLALCAPLIALRTTASIYFVNPRLLRLMRTMPTVYLIKLAWCWGAVAGLIHMKSTQSS